MDVSNILFNRKMNIHLKLDDYETTLYIKVFDREKRIATMTVLKYVNENYLKIGDISEFSNSKYINKGIGSMMMKELLNYAESNNYQEIRGELSIVDNNHKDRLHHFYQKFGFEITETNNRNDCIYATICKRVRKSEKAGD